MRRWTVKGVEDESEMGREGGGGELFKKDE